MTLLLAETFAEAAANLTNQNKNAPDFATWGVSRLCNALLPSSPNSLLPEGEGGPDSKSFSPREKDLG